MSLRWLLLAVVIIAGPVAADDSPRPEVFQRGLVVCTSPPAAEVGASVLRRGGNAVDAAVAVAFAEAVTYPIAGNIGGGGFMLIHPPQGQPAFIDYRETAPAAATADMFANERDPLGPKSIGVPGTVRGLELAWQKYGSKKLSWAELLAPAIKLADEGFALEPWSARSLSRLVRQSPKHDEFRRVFGKPGGGAWDPGDVLKQPDLAKTLRHIAERGSPGFYNGPVADLVVAEMRRIGGLITADDLAGYRAKERTPIHGTYRGFDVWSAPPPSSGGTAVIEMLNMLECFPVAEFGPDSPKRWHLTAEVMRRSFVDRARHLGDPDFTAIPVNLIDKSYARNLARNIDLRQATPSASLAAEMKLAAEPLQTTHISVIDSTGLAVSNTYTLEESYGSRIVAPGAGFILNNEMLDFNHIPGRTDRTGKIGTPANVVAPGKRMLSSMTPTILARNGKVELITGSPGGRTIINTVLCVLTNVVDFGMDAQAAVNHPRIHHQWFPDEIRLERGESRGELATALEKLGHKVTRAGSQGDAHTIRVRADGTRQAGVDHRIMGKAAGQ